MEDMTRAVIITGDRGAGKTTLCLALAALSPRYAGLASPRLHDAAGIPVGFSARCLATGEEWVLARSDAELDGPEFGRFSFSSAGIARAVGCLRGVLSSAEGAEGGGAPRRAVVVIDEIGPLELERSAGLAPALPLLAAAGHLLLVVRPSLVDRVEALVPRHERTLVVVTPENRA
jgi:nucleoside-triphosphatase THEP1